MGVSFGGPLLGANENNEHGHFEHIPIKNTQVRLCQEFFGINGWLTAETIRDPGPNIHEDRLLEIVQAEVERWPLFGFKDPMTARLLPLWQRILRRLELEPVYVKCYRALDSIHASLQRALQSISEAEVAAIYSLYMTQLAKVRGVELWFEDWFEEDAPNLVKLADAIGWDGDLPHVFYPESVHVGMERGT